MNTSLHHLPPSQEQALKQAVSAIAAAIDPEKIICYGTRTWLTNTWSIVDPVLNSVMNTDYDLLIVTKPGVKRREHEILDIVAQHTPSETRIITIAHGLCAVNEAIKQGRPFFVNIHKSGILVYDSSGIPLAIPSTRHDAEHLADVRDQWNRHFDLAEKFFDGASFYIRSNSASFAIFMLHQATEHLCIALIETCLGYRPVTHNLTRLLALTENFSEYPSSVFPQISTEEVDLFNTLVRAYSDVRYSNNFQIRIEVAKVLFKRVEKLRIISMRLYKEKVAENSPIGQQ